MYRAVFAVGLAWCGFAGCSADPASDAGATMMGTHTPDARPNGTPGGAGTGAGAGGSGGAGRSRTGTPDASVAGSAGVSVAGRTAEAGASGAAAGASGAGASGAAAGGGGGAAAGGGGAAPAAASSGGGGATGAAGSSGAAGAAGSSGRLGEGGEPPAFDPIYRIELRVHTSQSRLTEADLVPIFAEVNEIWLKQAGICFEIEVTTSDENTTRGIDLRYTAGSIPGASGANGLASGQHDVWSIDRPNLGDAPNPVEHPTARTSAHEVGHVLGLAHQNPAPSNDCARPCHCETLGLNCDDFLMRSGRKGFFLSKPEVDIARRRAEQLAMSDRTASSCGAPRFE